jgi:adenylate cyclase
MPQYYLATREGFAEAIRLADCALKLDPQFGFVAALASVCYMNNVILGHASDPQFDKSEAIRLFRLALSVDDSDPETLALAAVVSAFMVGDCESEIEMADRAVALNPNSFHAWHYRGWVYKTSGLPGGSGTELWTCDAHEPGRPAATPVVGWHGDGPY